MSAGSQNVAVGFGSIDAMAPDPYAEQQMIANGDALADARANSALPVDSWEEMDSAVYRGEDNVLVLADDLRAAGLTDDASIYDEELTWQVADTSHDATISMSPETETDEGAPSYKKQGVPLPIIHADYSIGMRQRGPRGVAASGDLDTLNAYGSSYVVNRTFENMLLYGWGPTIGQKDHTNEGYSLYGLTNFPGAGSGTVRDWGTDPTYAREDIRNMIYQLKNEQNHAPGATGYWLYLATDLEDHLEDIVDQQSGDTVRDRISSLSGLSRVAMLDTLPAGAALMFRPTEDVIDIAIAEDLQTVQWDNPFRDHYKVMLSATPRIKSTYQGDTGITYWT